MDNVEIDGIEYDIEDFPSIKAEDIKKRIADKKRLAKRDGHDDEDWYLVLDNIRDELIKTLVPHKDRNTKEDFQSVKLEDIWEIINKAKNYKYDKYWHSLIDMLDCELINSLINHEATDSKITKSVMTREQLFFAYNNGHC